MVSNHNKDADTENGRLLLSKLQKDLRRNANCAAKS